MGWGKSCQARALDKQDLGLEVRLVGKLLALSDGLQLPLVNMRTRARGGPGWTGGSIAGISVCWIVVLVRLS